MSQFCHQHSKHHRFSLLDRLINLSIITRPIQYQAQKQGHCLNLKQSSVANVENCRNATEDRHPEFARGRLLNFISIANCKKHAKFPKRPVFRFNMSSKPPIGGE